MTPYKLCAYWKGRKESIDACAERLAQFAESLSACDVVFSKWFRLGMSPKKALQNEVDFRDRQSLIALLDKGRHRNDVGNEVLDDLGFGVGLWNGGTSTRMVGLSITCGLYSVAPGLGGNCVVLDLPEELGDLQQWERMANVLAATAESWEPDWAGVCSLDAITNRNFNAAIPFVDWMLYISRELVAAPSVPEALSITPVSAIGFLIVVHQGPTELDNSTHLRKVQAIEAAIGIS